MPDIVSPIDGAVAFTYSLSDPKTALARIEAAEAASRAWRREPLSRRIEVCLAMLERYGEREQEHAQAITMMMGKPVGQARGEFRGPMRARTQYLCEIADSALADVALPTQNGSTRFIRREPVGVVLDIAAWNYPLIIAINVLVPAVLAGDAVILKHAHQTALVAEQLADAFRRAGAPEGLVQPLYADHATVAQLLAARKFGFVSFTGSVRGGHEVYRAAAQDNFVGVGLELGGKDPAIVLPDCDFAFTVENLVDGAFYNAGQSCCGIERIYVHADVYDRFVEAYAELARGYVVADPRRDDTTMGPLVDARAAAHVKAQIADAEAKGARRLVGPEHFTVPDTSACWVAPHVYDRVDHRMELMREETFGPAIGIQRVTSEAEAIALANDSQYGLTASVWTTDDAAGRRVAEQLDAGTVFTNRCDYLDPGLPWTGVKDSGHGASLSHLGFQSVTRPKSFHLRTRSGT